MGQFQALVRSPFLCAWTIQWVPGSELSSIVGQPFLVGVQYEAYLLDSVVYLELVFHTLTVSDTNLLLAITNAKVLRPTQPFRVEPLVRRFS